MITRLSDELREALARSPGQVVRIEDETTRKQYVSIAADRFEQLQTLLYDDSEFNPEVALPSVAEAFGGPEGWDAPGMEAYDDYDAHRPGA